MSARAFVTELYPAIDLRAGRVVRLTKGDYDAETVYGDDPVAVAAVVRRGRGARGCTSSTWTRRDRATR